MDIGVGPVTVRAHVPFDQIFDHKCLLQDGAIHDIGLDCQLHFQPFAVRLGPYESGINQLHFL
jgi:hypothetical protein